MRRHLATAAAALAGLLTLGLATAPAQATPAASRTPPMGWCGYNQYGPRVTEQIVRANAAGLVSSGLAAAGYQYVNLDGGWAAPTRDANGRLTASPDRFPSGIPALAAYVHSLGLKFGIYESAGTTNCAGNMPGGYPNHYATDAATFAGWGVDYVKFDYCKVPGLSSTGPGKPAAAQSIAAKMAAGIAATGRPMVFDVNDANAARSHDLDWQWGRAVGGNLWRTGSDIKASYSSMYHKIFGEAGSRGRRPSPPMRGRTDGTTPTSSRWGTGRSSALWRRRSCRCGRWSPRR